MLGHKSKDRERKRVERSMPNAHSADEIARQKKLNRDRVRKCRLLLKAKQKEAVLPCEEPSFVYKTPQALGKAVGRVKAHRY